MQGHPRRVHKQTLGQAQHRPLTGHLASPLLTLSDMRYGPRRMALLPLSHSSQREVLKHEPPWYSLLTTTPWLSLLFTKSPGSPKSGCHPCIHPQRHDPLNMPASSLYPTRTPGPLHGLSLCLEYLPVLGVAGLPKA